MTNSTETRTARWRKSSYSSDGGDCLEVAGLTARTAVRDSKNPTGPALILSDHAWAAFVTETKRLH